MRKKGNRDMRKNRRVVCLAAAAVLLSGCSGRVPWVSAAGESVKEEAPDTAENRLEAVRQSGMLRIGISADYAPFAFELPDEALPYAGADLELGRYIAEELGAEAEFVEMGFDDCMAAVAEGSVDLVLLGMLPKADRHTVMDYTDVYYEPGRQVIIVKNAQEEKLQDPADFEGKTVAAQYGSLQAQLLAEQFPGSYPELTDNAADAVLALRQGRADGVILEEVQAQKFAEEYPELAVSRAALDGPPKESVGVVGGVVKGEPELLQEINGILKKVTEEGRYLEWLDGANEQAMSLPRPTR